MNNAVKPTALIAGSSGLTGNLLLDHLLASDQYTKVISLVRKKSGRQHPKLEEVLFDYEKPDALAVKADHIFCCLGTTIKKAGSRDAFYKVDYTYPLLIAKLAKENGASFYGIVTAMGANAKSGIFYNRVKGDVEDALKLLKFDSLAIFRPSMLLGDRKEDRTGESMGQKVMTFLDFLIPKKYKAIQASKVARAMAETAAQAPEGINIIESDRMY